ncbi:MAG TPA: hypothetical protein VHB79_05635 [Polyangiaceae bacterium]|nr:hypothetical protein [Polyangiaceae bacterium]
MWASTKGIKVATPTGAAQTLVTAAEMGGYGSLAVDAKSVVWWDSKNDRVLRKAR